MANSMNANIFSKQIKTHTLGSHDHHKPPDTLGCSLVPPSLIVASLLMTAHAPPVQTKPVEKMLNVRSGLSHSPQCYAGADIAYRKLCMGNTGYS